MNKEGHILINLGHLKIKSPINSMQILVFGVKKYQKKFKKNIKCLK